jgi:hypothetical protein
MIVRTEKEIRHAKNSCSYFGRSVDIGGAVITRCFALIIGLAIMMFSCQEEEILSSLTNQEFPDSTIISDKDDALFAYKNREDSLKNRIIAALKHKNEQSSGIVLQSVAPYGQPLWDESESVTVDSAVRILVPMYDSLVGDIVGLWCFDNRVGSDSVYYGVSEAPPALNDAAFAIDLNLVYDYFRFKLGLPTERNVRFEKENNMHTAASVDIAVQTSSWDVTICETMCGYVGVEIDGKVEFVEKGCFTRCTFYMIPVADHRDDLLLSEDGELGGGGSGGNGDNQKKEYTITVSATTGGIATGSGTYPGGSLIALSAQAINKDYVFEHWMLNGSIVSTNPTYALTVSANQSYVATFITQDCYNKRKIAENTNLNAMLTGLKGNAQKDTNEVAMFETFNYDGNNTILSGKRNGIAGEAGFPNLNGGTYNWMFHSHPLGEGVIFSGRDLMSLYQIYTNHLYTNLSSFLWGIVNHKGGTYALSINNPALFEQFARLHQLDGSDSEYIINALDYKIDSYNISEAEKGFTEFINGSGLVLLKMDSAESSQNTWSAIEYNTVTKEIVTQQPCN